MSNYNATQMPDRLKPDSMGATWGQRVLGLVLLTALAMPASAVNTNLGGGGDAPAVSIKKFSSDLNSHVGQDGMVTVIVQYRQMPTASKLTSLQGRGATLHSKLQTIKAVTLHVPASMLAELQSDPNVLYVSPDRNIKMTANPATEEFATAVEADVAASNYGLTGSGVGVAVIDSGIASHPDLNGTSGTSRVVYSQSFVAGDTTTSDKFGHGTHVAGLIGGSGDRRHSGGHHVEEHLQHPCDQHVARTSGVRELHARSG
jgi:subtilisin family serine protease